MGLLDDAIREHLDLKRRRGADPSEIEREEAEALGPVRRDAPSGEPDGAPEAAAPSAPALDEPAVAYDDEAAYDDEPAFEDEPAPDHERPHPADPPATHDDVWAEPEEESATPPHGDPLAYQQTREFSATELGEALGRAEPDAAAPPITPEAQPEPVVDADDADPDDELEETPDFLQETPEHDRLWFEQKPPKDFDF
jgi:hypothetical protein